MAGCGRIAVGNPGGAARHRLPKLPRGTSTRQIVSCRCPRDLTVAGSFLAQLSSAAVCRIRSRTAWTSGSRLAVEIAFRQQTARDRAAALEDGEPDPLPRFGCDYRRTCDGHARAVVTGTTARCTGANLTEGGNPGKKSSKFNQDCTICPSCREAVIGDAVLKQRTNRVKRRTFGGPFTLPFTGIPVRLHGGLGPGKAPRWLEQDD